MIKYDVMSCYDMSNYIPYYSQNLSVIYSFVDGGS